MNVKRYAELKASGDMYLDKIAGVVHVIKKNYDNDTGKAKDPDVLKIDKDSYLQHKAVATQHQAEDQEMIDAVTLFLADVEVLETT